MPPGALIRLYRQNGDFDGTFTGNNEDDHENFDQPANNFTTAIREHVSWGWFDYRRKGELLDEGYQSPPVNWGISPARKRGFFTLCADIAGGEPPPGAAGNSSGLKAADQK